MKNARTKMTVILSVIVVQGILVILTQAAAESAAKMRHSSLHGRTIDRALSLSVLQQRVKRCQTSNHCPDSLTKLGGLTHIAGYFIDERNRDIILFGEASEVRRPLYTDDLVIALRNTWLKYAEIKGRTRYYTAPTVSIDPKPEVLRQLDVIGIDDAERWRRVCQQFQTVRILGIPFDSRFAKTMVHADYDLKKLVGGPDNHHITGLVSLTGMRLLKTRQDMATGRASEQSVSSMHRFWFSAGDNLYYEDAGAVLLTSSPVILMTEQQFLNSKGKLVGAQKSDPIAQKFVNTFSTLYPEIARRQPIYADLENLFRMVALTKIFKYKQALAQAGLTLTYLLDDYQITHTVVERQMPGYANVIDFEERLKTDRHDQSMRMYLPSCGGVGMGIHLSNDNFIPDKTGIARRLKQRSLHTRPSQTALFWDIS